MQRKMKSARYTWAKESREEVGGLKENGSAIENGNVCEKEWKWVRGNE